MRHLDFTSTMIVGSDDETNYDVQAVDDFILPNTACEHCGGTAEYVVVPPTCTHGEPFWCCQQYMLDKFNDSTDPDHFLLLEGGTPVHQMERP